MHLNIVVHNKPGGWLHFMYAFIVKRIFGVIVLLAGVNFISFAYAHYGRYAQLENNPIFARQEETVPVFRCV